MADNVIELVHLQKQFGDHAVLRDINLSVKKGEVLSIIGASGSGKSTMLRCINLLETPSSGQVLYHGQDITAKDFNLTQYRTKVGMVFQSFNLFNNMSALNNCIAGQVSALRRSRKEAEEIAMEYLTKVGMAPYINARPSQLSGGQKQRVAIARALAMQPEVLLFDEPTSALDPQMVGEVLDVMRRLAEEGLTMIVVTHEMAFARDVSTDVVYMSDGVICEQGKPHELFENPQNPKTREVRILGNDPKTGHVVKARIGRYGPMVEIEGNEGEKSRFASLKKGQLIESITLEEALELFALPRGLGQLDGEELTVGIGKYGPYVRYGKSFASLAKTDDPYTITYDRAVEIVHAHKAAAAAANTPLKSFPEDPDMLVKNGRYGAYIAYKGKNYRLPKGAKPEELTLDECLKIVAGSKK